MKKEILKVGVVGTGNMGRNHLRVLSTMAEYELAGCFDTNTQACEEQADIYGITAFTSAEELYNAVDVVNIVVPSFLHKEYAVAAAEAGCHVLVEKPIALTVDDAQCIIDACKKAEVRLCVGHVERFNPAIITMQNIIAQEGLIAVSFERMSPFYGRISDASVVEDLMIHDIDVLNAIAGNAGVVRIVSHGAKVHTNMLDYAQALVTYDNGLIASLTASRVTETKIREAKISALNSYIAVDYLNRTVEISRKTNFSLDVGYPVQYKQENIVEKIMVPISEPLRSEFEHFAFCIHSGLPISTSGEMGKRALELCQIIQNEALIG